eukprot:13329546-Alexandrium_andersonii.AAC.1
MCIRDSPRLSTLSTLAAVASLAAAALSRLASAAAFWTVLAFLAMLSTLPTLSRLALAAAFWAFSAAASAATATVAKTALPCAGGGGHRCFEWWGRLARMVNGGCDTSTHPSLVCELTLIGDHGVALLWGVSLAVARWLLGVALSCGCVAGRGPVVLPWCLLGYPPGYPGRIRPNFPMQSLGPATLQLRSHASPRAPWQPA